MRRAVAFAVVALAIGACRDFDKFLDSDAGADGGLEITGPCSPDCPKIDMVTVPAGEYLMGCNDLIDIDCEDHERPGHKVTVSDFMIDRTELTVANYDLCVKAGECLSPDPNEGCNYGIPGRDMYPVNCITWQHADRYCKWVGKRLPTEAEWEKAARGEDSFKYPWGNTPPADCDRAVMYTEIDGGGVNGCGRGELWPVGSKPKGKSPYGCEDMAGNAGEWVSDWYSADYFAQSSKTDPKGPANGTEKVIKSGAYVDAASRVRASFRHHTSPNDPADYASFRCAFSR
jgi:formylglycine-generating enzyme required for sulfatase activity